jgi:hypothetical protein
MYGKSANAVNRAMKASATVDFRCPRAQPTTPRYFSACRSNQRLNAAIARVMKLPL